VTMVIDYRRDQAAWHAFVKEIDALVLRLPDGAQQRTRFEQAMRFCDNPDDYLTADAVPQGGSIVYRTAPGPKALAFRDGLLAALEGGAA